MPMIVWKTKAENPGPLDTRHGHVGDDDRPRFVIEYVGNAGFTGLTGTDEWKAGEIPPAGGIVTFSPTRKYVECVDWCWQRLAAGA